MDNEIGIIHLVETTVANVHGLTLAAELLLHREGQVVYRDDLIKLI